MKPMKILTLILVLFLVITGILWKALSKDSACENLIQLSNREALIIEIWEKVKVSLEEPQPDYGSLYLSEGADKYGIDWDKLGIPKDLATVGLWDLDFNKEVIGVSKITMGYGYRKHLVFNLYELDGTRIVNGYMNKYPFELSVVCD